jgi:hypothetical protein
MKRAVAAGLAIAMCVSLTGCENASKNASEVSALAETKFTITSGNFVSGVDFAPGEYDITAIGGTGQLYVYTPNDGESFKHMSENPEDPDNSYYTNLIKQDNNVLLPSGSLITVNDMVVELDLTNSQDKSLNINFNKNPASKEISFSKGKYTAGKDFPVGTYDLTYTEHYGNVWMSNMIGTITGGAYKNESESAHLAAKDANKANESDRSAAVEFQNGFKNATFSEGDSLEVSSDNFKMTPSKNYVILSDTFKNSSASINTVGTTSNVVSENLDPAHDYKPLTSGKFAESINDLNQQWNEKDTTKGASVSAYINGNKAIELIFCPSAATRQANDKTKTASEFISTVELFFNNFQSFPELDESLYVQLEGHDRIAVMITHNQGMYTGLTYEDTDMLLNQAVKMEYDSKLSGYDFEKHIHSETNGLL